MFSRRQSRNIIILFFLCFDRHFLLFRNKILNFLSRKITWPIFAYFDRDKRSPRRKSQTEGTKSVSRQRSMYSVSAMLPFSVMCRVFTCIEEICSLQSWYKRHYPSSLSINFHRDVDLHKLLTLFFLKKVVINILEKQYLCRLLLMFYIISVKKFLHCICDSMLLNISLEKIISLCKIFAVSLFTIYDYYCFLRGL